MKNLLNLILLLISSLVIGQVPFDCNDGNFYQVISGELKAYDPITGTYSAPLHSYPDYNAGGYNTLDNFMYAINKADKHLLRIGTDQIIDLGEIVSLTGATFGGGYAADMDPEGNLWVYQNTSRDKFHKIIDVQSYNGTTSPIFEEVYTDATSPGTSADIVYVNGSFYGGGNGNLYRWDLASGTPVMTYKTITGIPSSVNGAAYADSTNRLYISDNKGGLYLVEDYETNPKATLLNMTELTNSNDGFKCASGRSPLDKDNDGILDSMDDDADGDGIRNSDESKGVDPYGDSDNDQLYNYLDNDTSGNGNNVVQDDFDVDQDGIPNFMDLDSDNDGIYDIVESGYGSLDTNNDGKYNFLDTNYNPSIVVVLLDSDGDSIPNAYDIDSDNDGIIDLIEGQNGQNFMGLSGIDKNRNGVDDVFDIEFLGTPNGTQDSDGDGQMDYLDMDSDNDGITDTVEAYDNDGDGVADIVPSGIDTDGDGLDNAYDRRNASFDASNGTQNPATFPVPTICDRYTYLGEFNSEGTPLYLEESDVVSQETLDLVANSLPESYPVPEYNPHYISSGYDTDLIIDAPADVWVTFVSEGAGYKNVLGYYTYEIDNPSPIAPKPEDITIIFPNVSAKNSGGELEVGNKVKIGSFSPNTGIGWVLLANAWSNGCVREGQWQLYSNTSYNPEADTELRHHNVLLSDPTGERIILGFEDIRRDNAGCDNDFNDAVFYITANPYAALRTANYADVNSATNVSSGNNGGLESNGDLAELIAERNFNRVRNNTAQDVKQKQARFQRVAYRGANQGVDFASMVPETGMFGTETTFVSSPKDLIGITNAKDIFSIDYYQAQDRVAAVLATQTEGKIYDHSKIICDRLNDSSIEDVRTIQLKGYEIILTKIRRANDYLEYALSFSVEEGSNTLHSYWNIDQYPTGDYLNFQVWGGSMGQVSTIANHILAHFEAKSNLNKVTMEGRIPTVFIKEGLYRNGKLYLKLINKSNATSVAIAANKKEVEGGQVEVVNQTIAITNAYEQEIEVNIGGIFDVGLSLVGQNSPQADALYLADGPWGIDYDDSQATVASFEITSNSTTDVSESAYFIERDVVVSGDLFGTLNIFRNILPGDLAFDITGYDKVNFEIKNDLPIEVIMITEGLENWEDRLVYQLGKNPNGTRQTILLSDFRNRNGEGHSGAKIKGFVFSVQGDYNTYQRFSVGVSNLILGDASTLSIDTLETSNGVEMYNYPNPFTDHTTIVLPQEAATAEVVIYSITGQKVSVQLTDIVNKSIMLNTNSLPTGIYIIQVITDTEDAYTIQVMKK